MGDGDQVPTGAAASVRLALRIVRRWSGFSNHQNASAEVKRLGRRSNTMCLISDKTLERIESGRTDVKYWHLEAVQDLSGIPTGVLLVSSHIMSFLRDDRRGEAQDFALRLGRLSVAIDRIAFETTNFSESVEQSELLCRLFEVWKTSGMAAGVDAKESDEV